MKSALCFLVLTLPFIMGAKEKSPFYKLSTPHKQSVIFKRLSDGKVIYSLHADQALSPASTSKLVVAAAALSKFTPAHRFATEIYHDGKRQGGIISGNIYFKGDGDPMLINEKLWQMAADFHHMGIRQITGNIIIDATIFDDKDFDASRQSSKLQSSNAYNAPVSGFGVNFNTYPIAISPGPQINSPALVSIDPYPIGGIAIRNSISTVASGSRQLRITRTTKDLTQTVYAKGTIPIKQALVKVYRAVNNPTLSAGEIVRSFLNQQGIAVKGQVLEGRIPTNGTKFYILESYKMSRIISGLNKYSNNYIADVLLKNLGANFSQEKGLIRGSLSNGLKVVKDFLDNDVKVTPGYQLYNGSGLDARNRLSAQQIVEVLSYLYKRMDVFPEFLASLPASGWDGTLEDRFSKEKLKNLKGIVRAKTGSLTSPVVVSSLAGYMGHPEHGMVAFAIIENGISMKRQPSIVDFRARQDLALQKIVESF